MHFSYNKLWKLLIDRNISKQQLRMDSNVSSATLAKMRKGANVNTDILLRICKALDCDITDIMELVRED